LFKTLLNKQKYTTLMTNQRHNETKLGLIVLMNFVECTSFQKNINKLHQKEKTFRLYMIL